MGRSVRLFDRRVPVIFGLILNRLGQPLVEITLSICNRSIEKIAISADATHNIFLNVIEVTIFKLAIREGKLFGPRIQQKRAVHEYAIIKPCEV